MKTVLLSDASSYKAIVVARYLRNLYPDAKILGCDFSSYAHRLHTRFMDDVFVVPRPDESELAYTKTMGSIIRRHGVDILLPVNSREIRLLLAQRDLLDDSLSYMGSYEHFCKLDDKQQFAELLVKLGLPHPKSHESIRAGSRLVMKPRQGSSAKGVVYLDSSDKAMTNRVLTDLAKGDYLLQEFVSGEGVGYSGFFDKGRIAVGYAHRRVSEFPTSGGSSVVRDRYPYNDQTKLMDLVRSVLNEVPWTGFAMFEFKRTPEGELIFIECNPRIWGSIHQGLADGVNYFEPLLGPGLPASARPSQGIRTELFPLSWLVWASYLRSNNFRNARIKRPRNVSTLFDVSPRVDPLGFIALCLRTIKKQ